LRIADGPIALFLIISFAALWGGCARAPRAAGVLRLVGTEPSTLDPAKSYDTTSISLVRVLYRGLVDYGDGANIVPAVAKSYTISPDGKTYTFTLRPDAYFHFDLNGKSPGRRVVARDFRYAIERVLDPATASDGLKPFSIIDGAKQFIAARAKNKNDTSHLRGITVAGDDKISIRLSKPDATFLNWLTLPFSYAVPREWVEKWEKAGDDFSNHPNGCGPFLCEAWVHGDYVHFKKNPRYYDKSLPRAARLEQQIQIGSASGTLQLMRFELGDIDLYSLEDTPTPDYLRLKRDPKWQPYILHAPMMDVRYLCMNTELKPFDNRLVRQAVNYAINKERIVATLAGRVQAARGVLPPGMPAYNPHLQGYDYDPDKARALLKKAGYKDDPAHPLTLWYADMVWYPYAAQSIQQDLKRVGMTVNLKSTTYPELKAAGGQRKNVPLSIMGWLQDFPDPANFLDVLFNGKNITQTASLNRSFYSNPRVNALLDAAGTELNHARRMKMYQQAEQLIMNDAPWVPLVHTERYVAHQPWIEGFTLHPMWAARYEYVKVNR
jgi:ABC-type transport system substrate-binding protein